MAIILEGSSKCVLCGNVLDTNEEYILLPPLISNQNDPLFIFSDGGVHLSCLDKNENKSKLLHFLQLYNDLPTPNKLKCEVDGQIISNPRNLITFGLLTSDEREDLYKFNFTVLNMDNLNIWSGRNEFISVAQRFIDNDGWKASSDFNYLQNLVNKIKR